MTVFGLQAVSRIAPALRRCASVCVSVMLLPVLAMAQKGVAPVQAGNFELGGFVGASYGAGSIGSGDYRVMGGGNLCYGVSKYIMPYVEYSYFPGIGHEQTGTFQNTGQTYTLSYSVPLSDIHGGVHIRVPIRESRIVPYFVAGFGALTNRDSHVTAHFTAFNMLQSTVIAVPGNSAFAANFGGGLRFYTSQHFGFRLEAKAYKQTGTFTNVFGKVEGGFFYQFR